MSDVVLLMGYPASGKSTVAKDFIAKGYVYLNRDSVGGKVVDLVPALEKALPKNVIIDNTFPTIASRKPFIDACKKANVAIRCLQMDTKIEDAQINALHRMWERHQKFFFHPDDLKKVNDPNMFPVAALFKYRKELQPPTKTEGFADVEKVKFTRRPTQYTNKALILDYDDTLRIVKGNKSRDKRDGELGYPTHVDHVELLPNRVEKIKEYQKAGYILVGVSNQSGIHKGTLSYETAVACFERTNELLGLKIDYHFCPHQSNPPTCYCRKPQSGNFIALQVKYQLNFSECIFVGDQTSDKTAAERLGIKFFWAKDFFN